MSNEKSQKKKSAEEVSSRDRSFKMCLWFAEMRTPQEVADLVKEEFDIEYTRQLAYQFAKCKRWSGIIRHLKERFIKDLAAIPIANKAVRLKYLQRIYSEALTESLKSINEFGSVYELKLSAAIEAIKAAREEIEGGNKTIVDQSKHVHYHLGDRLKQAREKANAGRIPATIL